MDRTARGYGDGGAWSSALGRFTTGRMTINKPLPVARYDPR